MEMSAPEILALQAKVRAADEEFHIAIACHEAWKPAAYDSALHARIGTSYAANTFLLVRQVLRREVVLSLTRLWDDDKRSVGMGSIANCLSDKRILDALAGHYAAEWGGLRQYNVDDIPVEERPAVLEAIQRNETQFGLREGEALRERAAEAIKIIRNYECGGAGRATLEMLMTLRNERLAHRQVKPSVSALSDRDAFDERVESFYQDMAKLIRLLLGAVVQVSYNPDETAEVARRNAGLFWASVRGERTEGHPNYRPVPKP
jgi:AbiU2